MKQDQFSRSQLIYGEDGLEKLKNAHVAIFGIGGVGSYTLEALARSGVGKLDIIDDDLVCLTNINRQIIATHSTVGEYKVDVAIRRVNDINPKAKVVGHKTFFLPETSSEFDFDSYDYVVDAIDTVSGKIELVMAAQAHNVPIISAMGAGNKVDPTKFVVTDIYKTQGCPLAKVMRRELRKRGVKGLKVVYSQEIPLTPVGEAACRENCICPKDVQRRCTD